MFRLQSHYWNQTWMMSAECICHRVMFRNLICPPCPVLSLQDGTDCNWGEEKKSAAFQVTPTAYKCQAKNASVIDTPAILCVCLCVCLHAWVVRQQCCEWTEGCALADGSSETRNAIHSAAHPHWEKEGGIRWVSEFLPLMPFLRRITFCISLRRCTDLPFPAAPIIHSSLCHSHTASPWLNAVCHLW